MNELTQTIGSALLLEDSAFEQMRDAENSFARGLMTIVVVSLIVGLVVSLVSFIGTVGKSPMDEMTEFQEGMRQAFEQIENLGVFGGDEVFWREFMRNFEAGIQLGRHVVDAVVATTPAPKPVVDFFQALGQWVSYPFGWISTWMFYGLLTLVFAKLLGGTATIREMLATTSLVAVPHLLDAFGFIPYIGFLVGLIAFVWGLAIYVKGTAIANRFEPGRALLAIVAPVIVLFALISLLVLLVVVLIIAAA